MAAMLEVESPTELLADARTPRSVQRATGSRVAGEIARLGGRIWSKPWCAEIGDDGSRRFLRPIKDFSRCRILRGGVIYRFVLFEGFTYEVSVPDRIGGEERRYRCRLDEGRVREVSS